MTLNASGKPGGICIGGHAYVTISDNDCERNKYYGILFRDSGDGVRGNPVPRAPTASSAAPRARRSQSGNDLDWSSRQDVGRW